MIIIIIIISKNYNISDGLIMRNVILQAAGLAASILGDWVAHP